MSMFAFFFAFPSSCMFVLVNFFGSILSRAFCLFYEPHTRRYVLGGGVCM
jgi:hypothetical protein